MRERRFFKGAEVRVAQSGHIEGHAAVFNQNYVLWDSPSLRVTETIRQGTFNRVLSDSDQDPRCLYNHNSDHVLGRKSAGTLTLEQNAKGLKYDCDAPDTQIGRDVRTSIQRRDITGCSFAFTVSKQKRTEEEKDGKLFIMREIQEVDNLYDVGPVTYPAYEGTDVSARSFARELRGIFPDGIPQSVRSHAPELNLRDAEDGDISPDEEDNPDDDLGGPDDDPCQCSCRACYDAECNECDMHMQECGDGKRCNGAMRSARSVTLRDGAKTKRVDGEDLTAGDFLYVGDANDTSTWKLPWKFSTDEKTKSHLRNALARFNQTQGIPAEEKKKVYAKLVRLAKKYGIHVAGEDDSESNSVSLDLAQARTKTLLAECQ